jgi:hypothetical protein
MGSSIDDMGSTDLVLTTLQEYQPQVSSSSLSNFKVCILGERNKSDFMFLKDSMSIES